LVEETFPFVLVCRVVVGFDATTGEKDGKAIRDRRVRKDVTICGHDPLDGTANGLVGGVGEVGQVRLDCEGSDNAVEGE